MRITRPARLAAAMPFIVILLLAVWQRPALAQDSAGDRPLPDGTATEEVIGGTPFTIDQAPWQVAVGNLVDNSSCGGSLIAPNLVMTAAHCVQGTFDRPQDLLIAAGTTIIFDFAGGAQWSHGADVRVHPSFDNGPSPSSFRFDVALIELATPFVLGPNVAVIERASAAEVAGAIGEPALITGWGLTDPNAPSPDDLRAGAVELLADSDCQFVYSELGFTGYNPNIEICAWDPVTETFSACSGDSGGPLAINVNGVWKQAGIVSYGIGDQCFHIAQFYAEVPAFEAWINANLPPVVTADMPAQIAGVLFDDLNGNGLREAGEPGISGQQVTLRIYGLADTTLPTITVGSVNTDSNGEYLFAPLVPDLYDIQIDLPDGALTVARDVGTNDNIDSDVRATVPGLTARSELFHARGGAVTSIDGGVAPAVDITVTVFEDTNANGILDSGEVTVQPTGSTPRIDVFATGESTFNDSGAIVNGVLVAQVGPGEFRAVYDNAGGPEITLVNVGNDDTVDNDFDPLTGETAPFTVSRDQPVELLLGVLPENVEPEPTATPTPAATATPMPTPTAEPTATPDPTPTTEATPTPQATPTAAPTVTSVPESTPTVAPTVAPTAVPTLGPLPTLAPVPSTEALAYPGPFSSTDDAGASADTTTDVIVNAAAGTTTTTTAATSTSGSAGSGLAVTGASTDSSVAVAISLLSVGGALAIAARRKTHHRDG